MNKIVIYYSMLGNTDYVAERIRKETGADLLRISPEKAYPDKGFRKFYWAEKARSWLRSRSSCLMKLI